MTFAPARAFAALGALFAGAAVALAALAMHAVSGHESVRLSIAAAIAFGHGLALVAIVARGSTLATLARSALALGTLLFAGTLVLTVFAGASPTLAPAGGMLLMAGWVILAADFLRTP
jgi:uncharacterized membrane protein YgdD (TMEM256/DUF423 family)